MSLFLLLDNRLVKLSNDVATEASHASYHRSLERFLRQMAGLSQKHSSWLSPPRGVLIASSSERTQLLPKEKLTEKHVAAAIEPKFPNLVRGVDSNWSLFLVDGVRQISNSLKTSSERIFIVIFSVVEALLWCDEANENLLVDGVTKFCQSVNKLNSKHVDIRIVCVQTKDARSALLQSQALLVERILRTELKTDITAAAVNQAIFSLVINSPLYFDEELRKLLMHFRPKVSTSLKFPELGTSACEVAIEILPPTTSSADLALQTFANVKLEVFQFVRRGGIHPVCLMGHGFVVKAAPLASNESATENFIVFKCLCKYLSSNDMCLVLSSSHDAVVNYWALIPPESSQCNQIAEMALIGLVCKESMLCSTSEGPHLSADLSDFHQLHEQEIEVENYFASTLHSFGVIDQFNPHSCPSGEISMNLSRNTVPGGSAVCTKDGQGLSSRPLSRADEVYGKPVAPVRETSIRSSVPSEITSGSAHKPFKQPLPLQSKTNAVTVKTLAAAPVAQKISRHLNTCDEADDDDAFYMQRKKSNGKNAQSRQKIQGKVSDLFKFPNSDEELEL